MMYYKFKIGDRVKVIQRDPEVGGPPIGAKGTVRKINSSTQLPLGIQFDNFNDGHDLWGFLLFEARMSGWNMKEEQVELIEAKS